MKRIELKVGEDSILLQLDDQGGGTIQSTLHIQETDPDFEAEYRSDYNAAMDGLESLILAHAGAGMDVQEARYVGGIRAALDAISNQIA